jgi:hypothetical protein
VSLGASGEEREDLVELGDVTVDHVDDLELIAVRLRSRGGAGPSTTTTLKLSSARLRTVDDTH